MINYMIVPMQAAPKGWECDHCRRRMAPGDHAFYKKGALENFVLHDTCALLLMKTTPEHIGPNQAKLKQQAEEVRIAQEFEELKRKYATSKAY